MPRQNKSRYAVLGFLSWQPASGYDIRRAIAESVGHFWSESYGQIYPALRELERDGLAVRSIEHTPGRPDRHVYTITDAGRLELERWLQQATDPHVYRVEVLIKLFFGEQVPTKANLAHIARYRSEHEALVARYGAIREHLLRDHRDNPRLPYWLLTVECGLKVGRAYLEWCDEAEREIRRLSASHRVRATRATPSRRSGSPRVAKQKATTAIAGAGRRRSTQGGH